MRLCSRNELAAGLRCVAMAALALVAFIGCVPAAAIAIPTATRLPPTPSPTAFSPTAVATPSPPATCLEEGTWTEFEYRGVAVAQQVPALAYLPPCYEAESVRYPAAYFLHGKPYTESQWIDLGLPAEIEAAAADGRMPPMIVVLARQPEPVFSNSDGGPGSYETEFLEGLLPAVDGAYRTVAAPEGRVIVGLSRGGVWALEIGLRNPDRIGAVAALSPSLAVNYAREPYDPLHLAATAEQLPALVFLGAGEEDWARSRTEALHAALTARGVAPELVIVPGDHSDPTWEALLPAVSRFLGAALGES